MAMKAAGSETVTTRYSYEVIWEREAIEMARHFVQKCTARECQWFHFIDKFVDEKAKKITYWISGMKIPYQTVTGTTVEADGSMMLKLALELKVDIGLMVTNAEGNPVHPTDENGERIPPTDEQLAGFNDLCRRMAVWCHSHVQMPCNPSGTDNEQWEDWIARLITDENPTQPVMMVIMNQKDEYFCRLYDPTNGGVLINPAFNIYESIDYKYIETALKDRVKQRTYNQQAFFYQGHTSNTNNTVNHQGASTPSTSATGGQGNSQGGQQGQLTSLTVRTVQSPNSGTQDKTSATSTTTTSSTQSLQSEPSDAFTISYLGSDVPALARCAKRMHTTSRCSQEAQEYITILDSWFEGSSVAWHILDTLLFSWDKNPQLKDLYQIDDADPAVRERYANAKAILVDHLVNADAPCEAAYLAAAEIAFVYTFVNYLLGDAAGEYQKDWDQLILKSEPERNAKNEQLIAYAKRMNETASA